MPHAIGRLDVAGRDLTLHLATLLRESGVVMNSSAEMEIVRWARGGGAGDRGAGRSGRDQGWSRTAGI